MEARKNQNIPQNSEKEPYQNFFLPISISEATYPQTSSYSVNSIPPLVSPPQQNVYFENFDNSSRISPPYANLPIIYQQALVHKSIQSLNNFHLQGRLMFTYLQFSHLSLCN